MLWSRGARSVRRLWERPVALVTYGVMMLLTPSMQAEDTCNGTPVGSCCYLSYPGSCRKCVEDEILGPQFVPWTCPEPGKEGKGCDYTYAHC